MDKIGELEIRVVGKSGNLPVNPDSFDIRHIANLLQDVEDLIYPNNKKERPLIAYNIQEGSVRHIFKTPAQYIIGFSAVLSEIRESNSIDFLDIKTAKAIERIQQLAKQKDYEFQFSTSTRCEVELTISTGSAFYRSENLWADAEFYFYGVLTNAGGKTKANIHLDTAEYGSVTIATVKDFLEGREENLLYKHFGVRAAGKQNIETGEMDTGSLKLIELIDYSPKYDADYLSSLISKAKKSRKNVDGDDWLTKLRGGYDA